LKNVVFLRFLKYFRYGFTDGQPDPDSIKYKCKNKLQIGFWYGIVKIIEI